MSLSEDYANNGAGGHPFDLTTSGDQAQKKPELNLKPLRVQPAQLQSTAVGYPNASPHGAEPFAGLGDDNASREHASHASGIVTSRDALNVPRGAGSAGQAAASNGDSSANQGPQPGSEHVSFDPYASSRPGGSDGTVTSTSQRPAEGKAYDVVRAESGTAQGADTAWFSRAASSTPPVRLVTRLDDIIFNSIRREDGALDRLASLKVLRSFMHVICIQLIDKSPFTAMLFHSHNMLLLRLAIAAPLCR